MNQIHYFITHNRWVAVAPGWFSETVIFCQFEGDSYPLLASIAFETGSTLLPEWYERVENGYKLSSQYEYTEARRKAQAVISKFLGDVSEFTAPATRPEYVERGGELILNDLPL